MKAASIHAGQGRHSIFDFGASTGLILLLVLILLVTAHSLLAADQQTNAVQSIKNRPGGPAFGGPNSTGLSDNSTGSTPASTSGAGSTNGMDILDDKHRLAIGDRLSFRIMEDEEDPRHLDVTDSGDLEVPYIGRFPAEGKSCKQLATALKAALEKEYYYQATVIVAVDAMAKSRGKVYLVGAIRSAGPQEIPSDEAYTLSKAILRSGGFTDFADKTTVRVTRKSGSAGGKDQIFTVNVKMILEKGKTASDLPLLPGDFIYVSERAIRF